MESVPAPTGERQEREAKLRDIRAQLGGVGDALGYGIEDGIVEEVAVFNAVGLSTKQSCEGHTDRGLPYAWIDVAAPEKPEYPTESARLAWEHAFARAAEETGVQDERELRIHHWDTVERHYESYPRPDEEQILPEYGEWERQNLEHESRALSALRRYQEETGSDGIVAPQSYGSWVRFAGLQEGESELARVWGERAALFQKFKAEKDWDAFEKFHALEAQAEALEESLPKDEESVARRRAAMSHFANWLKERWLAGENL